MAGILQPLPNSLILPVGEYRPLYEDDDNYYYRAPSKVVYNNLGSSLFGGGIYVARGTTNPRGWYYIDQDGPQQLGPFKTPPRLPFWHEIILAAPSRIGVSPIGVNVPNVQFGRQVDIEQ